jgi:hypothetical protein
MARGAKFSVSFWHPLHLTLETMPLPPFWLSLVLFYQKLREREERGREIFFFFFWVRERPISLSSSLCYISDSKKPGALGFSAGRASYFSRAMVDSPESSLVSSRFLSYILCQLVSYYCSISDFTFIANHA